MTKILEYTGVDDGELRLREEQEWQIQRWMEEPTKAILCGSDMDTGKTLCTVEFGLRMGFQRVLIIGIKDTFDSWADCTRDQSDGFQELRRIDATKKGQTNMAAYLAGDLGWFFIGQQYLTTKDWDVKRDKAGEPILKKKRKGDGTWVEAKQPLRLKTWDHVNPDLIVYDEVHVAANKATGSWNTLVMLKCEWKLGLSGTFYGNSFLNAFGPARWLWPHLIPASQHVWKAQWCEEATVYLKGGKTTTKVVGEKNPGEFVNSLPCYTAIEGGPEAPPAIVIEVDLLPEQRRIYNELEQNFITWLDGHPYAEEFPVVLRSRLRTATLGSLALDLETDTLYFPDDASSTKLEAAYPILEQRWAGQNAVICTDSKQFTRHAAMKLEARGHSVAIYSGDESSKQRAEIKARWLAGDLQYIIATSAFSTGVNAYQRVCNKVLTLSKFDSGIHNRQFIKRIYRTGGDLDGFEHIFISARDTKDAGQYASLELQAAAQRMSLRKRRKR